MERVPGLRERVYLDHSDEQYLVVWVDHARKVADLLPVSGNLSLQEDVAWERLRPLRQS